MDFVPELVDGAVILNAVEICSTGGDCRPCSELAVGVHNWLMANEIRYLVVDFQDEKYVCPSILTELLQLRKRLRYPFLFCGLMEQARRVLESYNYSDYPFFSIPEESVEHLRKLHPAVMMLDLSEVQMGQAIPCSRSRGYRSEASAEGEDNEVENDQEVDV